MKTRIYKGNLYERKRVNISGCKVWMWRDMKNNYFSDNYFDKKTEKFNGKQLSIHDLIK